MRHEWVQTDLAKIEREGAAPELGAAFAAARTLVEKSKLSEKEKESLRELINDAEERAYRYVEALVAHITHGLRRDTIGLRDPEKFQRALEESDERRMRAHNAYLDALNIMSRNLLQRGLDGIRPYAEKLAGQQNDRAHRRRVGDAALKFVWGELQKEAKREAEVGSS